VNIDMKMAWRNIWRNPRRTLLTVLAISFACVLLVFMLSFQFGSYATMINSSVRIHTGHLQIQARGYQQDPKMQLVVQNPGAVGSMLDRISRVKAYTFRANAFALVSSAERTYGVMITGIDPNREARVSTLAHTIQQGRYLSDQPAGDGMPHALIGRLLARNLKVTVGDELTVLGQGRDGSVAATVLKVRGIFASGQDAMDRSTIQMPLKAFQSVFSMAGAVHEVVIMAKDLADVPAVKTAIARRLPGIANDPPLVVLDWTQLMPGLPQAIHMDLISGAVFYLILIMVVAFSILNTFLMSILERTHEFGIMMAMGAKPGRLTRLVLAESVSMTLVGILTGVVIGCLVTWYFMAHGINLGSSSEILRQFGIPSIFYPHLTPLTATVGPGAVFVITLLAALYPALRIRKLRPVEAIGHA
jgi:putative ABC transport system permease protein